jgi:hypothetical protein
MTGEKLLSVPGWLWDGPRLIIASLAELNFRRANDPRQHNFLPVDHI